MKSNQPTSSEAQRLCQVVPEIMSLFFRLTQGMHCPADMTIPQFKVVQTLDAAGTPLRMTQVAKNLGISQSTLTDTVKRLVKSGHIVRARNENDDRVVKLSLTAKSRRVMEKYNVGLTKFFEELCLELPKEKRKLLLESHEVVLEIYQYLVRNREGKQI